MKTSKVWYVTGASQGLGLTLVKKLLQSGYRVAATSRDAQKLKEAVGKKKIRYASLSWKGCL
jgi:short-subunit dehydrogenase